MKAPVGAVWAHSATPKAVEAQSGSAKDSTCTSDVKMRWHTQHKQLSVTSILERMFIDEDLDDLDVSFVFPSNPPPVHKVSKNPQEYFRQSK